MKSAPLTVTHGKKGTRRDKEELGWGGGGGKEGGRRGGGGGAGNIETQLDHP